MAGAIGSDLPKWDAISEFEMRYSPLDSEPVLINVQGLAEKWERVARDCRALKEVANEYKILLGAATRHSVMLLFAEKSLNAIFRLYLDETDQLKSEEDITPAHLFQSASFLRDSLEQLVTLSTIEIAHQSFAQDDKFGFFSSDFGYDDGRLSAGLIQISQRVVAEHNMQEFKAVLKHFLVIGVAHEMIHSLSAIRYGPPPPKQKGATPDKDKYKIRTKFHRSPIRESGFSWERKALKAIFFALYEKSGLYRMKSVGLDFFGVGGDIVIKIDLKENHEWFANILRGACARLVVPEVTELNRFKGAELRSANSCRFKGNLFVESES